MSLDLRKWIIKCLVWSVALSAAETWTLSKTDIKTRPKHLKCGYGERWKRSAGQQKLATLKVLSRVMVDCCIVNTIKQ